MARNKKDIRFGRYERTDFSELLEELKAEQRKKRAMKRKGYLKRERKRYES